MNGAVSVIASGKLLLRGRFIDGARAETDQAKHGYADKKMLNFEWISNVYHFVVLFIVII